MKKKNKSFLREHYSLSWSYILECRAYIFFIVASFAAAFFVGLFYQPPIIVEWIKEFVRELLEETAGLNLWQMIIFILNNNLKNSFFAMLLGIFFGLFPIFTAFANGYVLGFIAEKSAGIEGAFVLWRLFPHGIFELPAVILALSVGTRLGFFWFVKDKKSIKKEFLSRLENALRVFLFIVLPLLVMAAIIEGILMFVIG